MGLGGHLMTTAVAHELFDVHNKRILPIEVFASGQRVITNEIFYNNPTIASSYDPKSNEQYIIYPLNAPGINYCLSETPERAIHRYDRHAIIQALEYFKINKSIEDVRCRIYFDDHEMLLIENLIQQLPSRRYVVIEPHSKLSYTPNRRYPFFKWQQLVDKLTASINVVQVGPPNTRVLNGVIDLTGQTTFRTCAGLIAEAKFFIASEGGLVHAANAVNTSAAVIITGYQHPDMIAYHNNLNFWVHDDHGPCGNRSFCLQCCDAVEAHDPMDILQRLIDRGWI